jgi:hypothetical protein
MGFRFRKSYRLGKSGARINLSKSGIGASVGGKGWRVGAGPRGTRLNTGIPGTPIKFESRSGSGRRRTPRRVTAQVSPAPAERQRRGCWSCFGLLMIAIVLVVVIAALS